MNREKTVSAKFLVKLRKVETELPSGGTSVTYVYPALLHQCRYGEVARNPNDDTEVILSVTGSEGTLEQLAQQDGVTVLSEERLQEITGRWV